MGPVTNYCPAGGLYPPVEHSARIADNYRDSGYNRLLFCDAAVFSRFYRPVFHGAYQGARRAIHAGGLRHLAALCAGVRGQICPLSVYVPDFLASGGGSFYGRRARSTGDGECLWGTTVQYGYAFGGYF